jgi:hypothetical protein
MTEEVKRNSARQGRLGLPVVAVLIVSLAILIFLGWAIFIEMTV